MKLGQRRNYHQGQAPIRYYANQPTRPLWSLRWHPNFMSTYITCVLNVKVLVGTYNQEKVLGAFSVIVLNWWIVCSSTLVPHLSSWRGCCLDTCTRWWRSRSPWPARGTPAAGARPRLYTGNINNYRLLSDIESGEVLLSADQHSLTKLNMVVIMHGCSICGYWPSN